MDELNADFAYTTTTIKKLNKSIKISDIKHGKLRINNVSSRFETIDVSAKFTDVSINFDSQASYNVELSTSFGKINIPSNSTVNRHESHKNNIQVKGLVGSEISPKAKVIIVNDHSNIDLR